MFFFVFCAGFCRENLQIEYDTNWNVSFGVLGSKSAKGRGGGPYPLADLDGG